MNNISDERELIAKKLIDIKVEENKLKKQLDKLRSIRLDIMKCNIDIICLTLVELLNVITGDYYKYDVIEENKIISYKLINTSVDFEDGIIIKTNNLSDSDSFKNNINLIEHNVDSIKVPEKFSFIKHFLHELRVYLLENTYVEYSNKGVPSYTPLFSAEIANKFLMEYLIANSSYIESKNLNNKNM